MNSSRRYWGVHTVGKLEVLEHYLKGFANTAKNKSDETLYFDLFAGGAQNVERLTNRVLRGSPSIALSIADKPFTRLRFFELEKRHAEALQNALKQEYPGRDFQVVPGDCNHEIHKVLAQLREFNWAPSFAFIDPNGPDVAWTTLQALADFKRRTKPKCELWILLADSMFVRTLPKDGSVRESDANRLTAMYGSATWKAIYEARVRRSLSPPAAREEYVNLMRWRLQEVLGYKWTHPLEFRTESGKPIYHMIFATDHDVGTRIMTNIYSTSRKRFPVMQRQTQSLRRRLEKERLGIHNLFGSEIDGLEKPVPAPGDLPYQYIPPWSPYGLAEPGGRRGSG